MQNSQLRLLRSLAYNQSSQCHLCRQWRQFHASRSLLVEELPVKPLSHSKQQQPLGPESTTKPLEDIAQKSQRAEKPDPKTFKPPPLGRPIGFPFPPLPFHNLERDMRSWEQRQKDFVSMEKHLERRQRISDELWRPYFKDWNAMKYAEGKIFLSNPRLFKRESALFFPNFWGYNLDREESDTVGYMQGKISVVCVFSRAWADAQCGSFVHEDRNPELWKLLRENSKIAQIVELNVEEGRLTRALLWAFAWSIKGKKKEPFQKYFILKRIKEDIRQVLGMINHKTGFVYLVDRNCRIRWAGSGNAWHGEQESLAAGLQRLIEQEKANQSTHAAQQKAVQAADTQAVASIA